MKLKVRCEIFFLFMTFFIILCLSITPSFAQYSPGYGMYGPPYGGYSGYGSPYSNNLYTGYPPPIYGQTYALPNNTLAAPYVIPGVGGGVSYNNLNAESQFEQYLSSLGYGSPYGGYGLNQPYNYGGYPSQPSGYAPNNYNYGQPNYGGYYQGYGYSQPQNYGGYPYRQPNYNQQYNYGAPSGYYSSYNALPYQYYGDPYTQQNPIYNPYGVSTGDWEDWSYLPSRYKDADLILDENDNDDDFTVDVGDGIAIILPSKWVGVSADSADGYEWAFDDDDFDDDIISHNNTDEWFSGYSGYQFWYFEAEEAGTTTIKIGNVGFWQRDSSIGEDTFEVEITVEED